MVDSDPRTADLRSPSTPRSTKSTTSRSAHGETEARKRSITSVTGPRSASHKRKVTRACDICKSKKAKCSGTHPCESCARRGLLCAYDAQYSRGKPPTPPQLYPFPHHRSASPRIQQPGAEANVREDESMLITQCLSHPRESRQAPGFTPCSVNDMVATPFQRDDGPTNLDTSAVNNQTSDFLHMATPEVAVPPPRLEQPQEVSSRASPAFEVAGQYSDPTSGLSFLHRAWQRLSDDYNSNAIGGSIVSNDENQLLANTGDKPFQTANTSDVEMPSLSRAQELLILYFDVCIATYRMLHRPTVERWLEIVVHNHVSKKPLDTQLTRPRTAIVLFILAVAIFHEIKCSGDDTAVDGSSSANVEPSMQRCDAFFCTASQFLDVETGFPKLESAQSRLIQVLYLLMSSRMNKAWYSFGHALQIISALGLHRRQDRKRPSQKQRQGFIEEQCSKRTFWVAYALDKYLGIIFGRPRHYHDDDIDQDFPDPINDEDMTPTGIRSNPVQDDCHIDSLIWHAKLAKISEKISMEVYTIRHVPDSVRIAASHRLGIELRQWKASLPPILGAINPSSLIVSFRRQATALNLAYCHAVMLAHRPLLLKDPTRNGGEIRESIRECIFAAQNVLEIVDRMARENRLFHAFWFSQYVCFCALGVVYVWAIQRSNNIVVQADQSDAATSKLYEQAELCRTHLAQATATNSPSRRYSVILHELRAEAKRKTARRPPELCPESAANDNQQNQDLLALNMPSVTDNFDARGDSIMNSPDDPAASNFLDDWQTTDWLDLDSCAFGPFPAFDYGSFNWTDDMPR